VKRSWSLVWVALGVVILIVGVAFLYVPVVPQFSSTQTVSLQSPNRGWYFLLENVSGYSITGVIPVLVSFTSSDLVDVEYATCTDVCHNFTQLQQGQRVAGTYQLGILTLVTGASISLNQPNGGSIWVAWGQQTTPPTSVNITYSVTTGLTVAGPLLLTAGLAVLVSGIVLLIKQTTLTPRDPDYDRKNPASRDISEPPSKPL
jgi:hypothetical protein